jgi:hypothetical protein
MPIEMISLRERTVFVTGAGFTRAFSPGAPLLVDDFGAGSLRDRFREFPTAYRVLAREFEAFAGKKINLERLMTRLWGGMPYDSEAGAAQELGLLMTDLSKKLMERLRESGAQQDLHEDLRTFGRLCVANGFDCITFNYDDALDAALWSAEGVPESVPGTNKRYWHPDGGYGFFCPPARAVIFDGEGTTMDRTSMLLLKLHGSMNWRVRRGYARPLSIDALVHQEPWLPGGGSRGWVPSEIERHLEPDPFIVLPILAKTALTSEPVLRLVWTRAFDCLSKADLVVFIGYSLPVTDIAARFLLREAIREDCQVHVVNLAGGKRKDRIEARYRAVLPQVKGGVSFNFCDARAWCRDLGSEKLPSELPGARPVHPAEAVKRTVTATALSGRRVELGSLKDGHAVLVDGMAAYWVSPQGEVAAANGHAKAWSPGISYSRDRDINLDSVIKAVAASGNARPEQ